MKNSVILTIFFLLLPSVMPYLHADILIADNATPKAVIILPEKPHEDEKRAADILKYHLEKITGASFSICRENNAPSGMSKIFVGQTEALPVEFRNRLQLGKLIGRSNSAFDAFLIAPLGNDIHICGFRPQGTVYAVYEFLYQFGVRYFSSIDACIIIPKKATLRYVGKERYFKPSFALREQYVWGTDPKGGIEFREANGLNHSLKGFSGHNFDRIWPKEKYPELFPVVPLKGITVKLVNVEDVNDGAAAVKDNEGIRHRNAEEKTPLRNEADVSKTPVGVESAEHARKLLNEMAEKEEYKKNNYFPYQVCVTNLLAAKIGAEYAFKMFAKYPDNEIVTYAINDGGGGDCMCENCRKLGNNADRYIYLANQIGKIVFQKYPEKMICIWSYGNCAQIPTLKIDGYEEKNDRVLVNIYEFFAQVNVDDLIEAWSKSSHSLMSTTTWYFLHWRYGPMPQPQSVNVEKLQARLKKRLSQNMNCLRLQAMIDGVKNGPNIYFYARMLWDIDTNLNDLKRDYAEKMFPSAVEDFSEFNLVVDQFSEKQLGEQDAYRKLSALLIRIYPKVKDSPEELKRWHVFAAWFAYMIYPKALGYTGDVGKSGNIIARNVSNFIGVLNEFEKIGGVLDFENRKAHQVRILNKSAYTRKDKEEIIKNSSCMIDFSVTGLLDLLRRYEKSPSSVVFKDTQSTVEPSFDTMKGLGIED